MMLTDAMKAALVDSASAVRKNAYAPYSRYPVGAALLAANGKISTGVNVENAAYPTGMCAERSALFSAVSEGERQFAAIAVVTANGGAPCGSCRQALSEFGLDMVVLIADAAQRILVETTVRELLPHAFGPPDLDRQA